jgi:hypothetical protein
LRSYRRQTGRVRAPGFRTQDVPPHCRSGPAPFAAVVTTAELAIALAGWSLAQQTVKTLVAAAAGYNFRRLLAWLADLWRVLIMAIVNAAQDATVVDAEAA